MSRTVYLLVLCIVLFSCGQNNKEYKKNAAEKIVGKDAVNYSIDASGKKRDSTRMFVRTAEMKFRVKDVFDASKQIEGIVTKENGFIIYTNLTSDIDNTNLTSISRDSSLETIEYKLSNSITIRIPNARLDTALTEISKLVDFLDYQIIRADDVSLQLLSNNLSAKRSEHQGKTRSQNRNSPSELQSDEDVSKLSNLYLNDQLKYSTIQITISQRTSSKSATIANNRAIDAYTPGLGSKILESFKSGWELVEALFLFIIRLWAIILISVLAFILYKKYKRNNLK